MRTILAVIVFFLIAYPASADIVPVNCKMYLPTDGEIPERIQDLFKLDATSAVSICTTPRRSGVEGYYRFSKLQKTSGVCSYVQSEFHRTALADGTSRFSDHHPDYPEAGPIGAYHYKARAIGECPLYGDKAYILTSSRLPDAGFLRLLEFWNRITSSSTELDVALSSVSNDVRPLETFNEALKRKSSTDLPLHIEQIAGSFQDHSECTIIVSNPIHLWRLTLICNMDRLQILRVSQEMD